MTEIRWDVRKQMRDVRRQMTDDRRQTTNDKRQATSDKRQTTVSNQQTPTVHGQCVLCAASYCQKRFRVRFPVSHTRIPISLLLHCRKLSTKIVTVHWPETDLKNGTASARKHRFWAQSSQIFRLIFPVLELAQALHWVCELQKSIGKLTTISLIGRCPNVSERWCVTVVLDVSHFLSLTDE
jgi:hypothetical protein